MLYLPQTPPQTLWCHFLYHCKRVCVISCPLGPSPATLFSVMLLCQACTFFVARARILVLQFQRVFGCSMHQSHPFPYSWIDLCLSVLPEVSPKFFQHELFMEWGWQPQAKPPTWRTRLSHFIWVITFDLSSMGGPTRSYATTSIALRILWPCKPYL